DGIRDDLVTGVQTCALPIFIGEDLPEAHNRVDLDPALADGHGIPAPRVTYALSENSGRMLDHGIARAREALAAAGARAVDVNPRSEERRVGKERRLRRGEDA